MANERNEVGPVGTFLIALLASWLVAEARAKKTTSGMINVAGGLTGGDDLHLTYHQSGTSVDVAIS